MSAGFTPALDSWLDEPDQCRPCHGPIVVKTRLSMIRDYACWALVMIWPNRLFMRFGMAQLLPYAGTHAFTCTCRSKIAAAKARGDSSIATLGAEFDAETGGAK